MWDGLKLAAIAACLAVAGCAQQGPEPVPPVTPVAPAPSPPSMPAPRSIHAYTDMLMFHASIRGDELRIVMQKSSNPHHSASVDYGVYREHVEGLCMCVIGKMECDWSGEPIHQISFLDVGGEHGYSFLGGEEECRLLAPLNSDQSAAFIKARTTRK